MYRHKVLKTGTEYKGIAFEDLDKSKHIEKVDAPLDGSPVETEVRSPEPYLADSGVIDAVKLAMALGRPLLLQGDPGTGKTRLAYAVAYELGLPLEIAYIKSTSQAKELLYTYDAVRRLYDVQMLGRSSGAGVGEGESQQRPLDFRNYVQLGPLGRAIARAEKGRRSVVLIDEIDKADIDFPNDLLWELDQLEFKVEGTTGTDKEIRYEVPKDRPELRPLVFITHNEEKALPSAFLRRCIFHFIEFPEDKKQLMKILNVQQFKDETLSNRAIDVLLKLRALDLNKKPGLSELLDWVGYLEAVQTPPEKLDELPMIGALLKQRSDQQRARSEVQA